MSLNDLKNQEWFKDIQKPQQSGFVDKTVWLSTTGANVLLPSTGNQVAVPYKSDNIVELGGGDKPSFRPNVDIRAMPTVDIVQDLEEDFSGIGRFDGIYGAYILEHISWKKVKGFIKSCYSILNEGGVAFFVIPNTYEQMEMMVKRGDLMFNDSCTLFGGQDYSDNSHKWALSPSLIKELFTEAGFSKVECVDHPNLECWDMFILAYRGEGSVPSVQSVSTDVKAINFGSFIVTFPDPFLNVDIRGDIKGMVESKGHHFMEYDVRNKLPWNDNEIDYITHHHLLEHLTDEEGQAFLKECNRILKPDGVMRLSVPNPKRLANLYSNDNLRVLNNESDEVKNAKYDVDAFWNLLTSGHKTLYDEDKLFAVLKHNGFISYIVDRHTSEYAIFEKTTELFPEHSLFVEATKSVETSQSVPDYKKYLEG